MRAALSMIGTTMTNLLPPRVKGPVSECSNFIRVQGQFPGATVEVVDVTSGIVVATGPPAASPDELFARVSALIPGRKLAARQKLGADNSGLSVDVVEVQKRPNPIGPVSFVTPLMQCARCLFLEGLVPGAKVEVRDGGIVIGTGESHDGTARVHLSKAIQAASAIEGQQNACGIPGTNTHPPGPLPPPWGKGKRVLPPPKVESPLVECSQRVTVSDVFPGATVDLNRSIGPDLSGCFDLPSLWFGVSPHLAVGETLTARQRYPDCEVESPWSNPPVVVDPLVPVPIPEVKGPLCKGGTNVTVCGLKAGSRVRITVAPHHHGGFPVGGTVYEAYAPEDGCFDFPFAAPGLPVDSDVYATQEMCGRTSDPSNVVFVDPVPDKLPTPKITEPLFECSTVVHVENLHPGSRVYVVSDAVGEIGQKQVFATEDDIDVAPMLSAGPPPDKIRAYAIGCGLTSSDSDKATVNKLDRLRPPRVAEPLYSCQSFVKVVDVVPGAWVDIYIDGQWRGRKKAGKVEVDVPVQVGKLEVGDEVTASQALCGQMSEQSHPPVRVLLFNGRWFQVGGDDKSEILAVHAALISTGQIVIFAGDQYDGANRLPNAPNVDHTRVMDTSPPYAVRSVTGLPPNANLFCCGHAMLEDGTIITGGGTERAPTSGYHGDHWFGPRESWRFIGEPEGSESWEAQGMLSMARPPDRRPGFPPEQTGGRWYPTLITLADGRVLAIGGHSLEGDSRHTNTSLELYDLGSKSWTLVGSVDYSNIPGSAEYPARFTHSEYPRCHVLRDATVFVASNMEDGDVHRWNPYSDPVNWTRVAGAPPGYTGNPQPYTSVLLALRHQNEYNPEVLVCGRETAYKIQPLASTPGWTPTAGRTMPGTPPRVYPLATLLPTGEVFVAGGTRSGFDADALMDAEMYDPRINQWRWLEVQEKMKRVRNYHSTALLMPSGAVWHSGSNRDCLPGPGGRDRTVEIYEPWYFCYPRPVIVGATSRACAGETINIETPNAKQIDEVVLVRCGSFTHAFNPDQRLVSVPFHQSTKTGNLLVATLPNNSAVLIPGYYLLFILRADHVPSEGRFVHICRSKGGAMGGLVDRDWLLRFLELIDHVRKNSANFDRLELELAKMGIASRRGDSQAVAGHVGLGHGGGGHGHGGGGHGHGGGGGGGGHNGHGGGDGGAGGHGGGGHDHGGQGGGGHDHGGHDHGAQDHGGQDGGDSTSGEHDDHGAGDHGGGHDHGEHDHGEHDQGEESEHGSHEHGATDAESGNESKDGGCCGEHEH
jgi:hypothetical protein